MRWSVLFLAAMSMVACKGKAVPVPPPAPAVVEAPPPPPPPEPEVPSCPARDGLVGTWTLITEVVPEVGGRMVGVNGFYTLKVGEADGCAARGDLTKTGWGRGSNTNSQDLKGTAVMTQKGRYWMVPISVGSGDDKTSMVLWLKQGSGKVQGYWHYTGNSWGKAKLFGTVEGRPDDFDPPVTVSDAVAGDLSACALSGRDAVNYETCAR